MAAATASPPAIPPRPSKSDDKASTSAPMVPPRPTNKRVHRPLSPNPERFAPSPLNESVFLKSPKGLQPHNGDPIPRSTSVELPSLGEEGKEYDNLPEELSSTDEGSASPEQTRTVAQDLKLHAPKPSLPASSAKQRVMTVTRTDSERAASFGIGRASSIDESTAAQPSNRSLRKKASTASQLSTAESHIDDEQGIPEIGLQVPMYKNAGDVQAPSPAPASAEGTKDRHHARKTSSRGNLPPGSYGLHGHGVAPQDKLEKAYFEKHPDLLRKEKVQHHYDRPNDYSMSREGLDKIVQETAAHGHGLAVKDYAGTPSDQVGWQALEESASRIASPGVASPELKPQAIHVDEPNRRRSVMFSDTESANGAEEVDRPYTTPILAEDEVAKDPKGNAAQPAVAPPFELEEPGSRPSSRPASVHRGSSFELRSTPLEDVEEYEPLFKDDDKKDVQPPAKDEKKHRNSIPNRFPSADVWEDAPSSVFYTAEVSTPELFDEQDKEEKTSPSNIPSPREGETAAQAFARHQEELAEKEAHGQRTLQKPVWAQHQKHLTGERLSARPVMHQRFPSRDVWEDAPESLQLETTVSTPQQDDAPSPSPADTLKADIPERPQPKSPEVSTPAPAPSEKPTIPDRPKPRQPSSTDDKPAIPERPKPAIPARPVKAGPTSGGLEPREAAAPPRQKPAVPARPMGSKIAALQAGFMNDLNRRLQLGPQAPPAKKEEPHAGEGEDEKAAEEKEKVPLADARKGRARGPQRRAPAAAAAASVAPAAAAEEKSKPAAAVVFGVAKAVTFFEIDPDEGVVKAGVDAASAPAPAPAPAPAAAEQGNETQESATAPHAEEPQSPPAPAPASESQAEPAPEPDAKSAVTTAPASEPQPTEPEPEPVEADKQQETATATETATETKSLATNMAGETLVAEQVKKEDEGEGGVDPVKVVGN